MKEILPISKKIYDKIKSDKFIQNKGYLVFIERGLLFVEQEILPNYWHSNFYDTLRYAWDFLHQKISIEQLYKQEKITFDSIENLEDNDKKVGNLVRWCLNSGLLTTPYVEQIKHSKFMGIKHEEIIITDNVMIFLNCLENISINYPEKFYYFLNNCQSR